MTDLSTALATFVADLRNIGLHQAADDIESTATDRGRAQAIFRHTEEIQLVDRQAFLRAASANLWAAFDARHRAEVETARAVAALESYRSPKGTA